MALVSVTFQNYDDGAPGPSPFGTGVGRRTATVLILFPIKPRVPPVSRTWRPVKTTIPLHLCRVFLPIRYPDSRRNREGHGIRPGLRAFSVTRGPHNSFAIRILAAGH